MITIAASAQTAAVRGSVRDAKTQQPLLFASVYMNLTTIGVYTDEKGEFVLKNLPRGKYDLIVSHVGYQTFQSKIIIKDDSTEINLDVKLVSQTLSAVTITSAKDSRWKSQLKRFHTLFFGNNPLSKDCKLLNSWVLEFNESPANGFSASAAAPLKIENLSLGYTLSYQLNKFQMKATDYVISGVSWFQQIPTEDTVLINLWEKRRRESYEGSLRHLLNAIQSGRIAEEGFSLYKDFTNSTDVVRKAAFVSNLGQSILAIDPASVVVTHKGHQFNIEVPPRLEVHYSGKKTIPKIYRNMPIPISWIEVKGGVLEINDYGMVLNPSSVMVSGDMGEARISSLLPYDYKPQPRKSPTPNSSALTASSRPELVMLERPYLHTDKSYYYEGEIVWIKAYMKYYSPVYSDTLSKVLFVDLVDAKKHVVMTKLFPIDSSGTVEASIPLKSLRSGDYQLRAYTRWILNFDKSLVYTKAIKVLSNDEIPISTRPENDSQSSLDISLAKEQIKPGERLSFSVSARNEYGFASAGMLSVAIAPASFTSPTTNIIQQYDFSDEILSMAFPKQFTHAVQQGIDVSGWVSMPAKRRKKKKRSAQPVIIFSQQNSDDMFSLAPEPNGHFRFPSLQFFDSARFLAQALILKDGKQLRWTIDTVSVSPKAESFDALTAQVVKNSLPRRAPTSPVDSTLSVRLLDEVTVTDSGTRPKEVRGSAIHLSADVVITSESLHDVPNGDLLSFLQSRVSGLRVLTFLDAYGQVRKVLKMGGFSSIGESSPDVHEPVVMIDGMVINGMGQTAADQLSSLSPGTVERIEVVKFGGGAAYGARGANGVISIYTNGLKPVSKNNGGPIDKAMFRPVNIPGYASPANFRIPPYDPSVSYDGTTIYWNPTVRMDGKLPVEISVVVPNVTGDYVIMIEGISAAGQPLRNSKLITIRKE